MPSSSNSRLASPAVGSPSGHDAPSPSAGGVEPGYNDAVLDYLRKRGYTRAVEALQKDLQLAAAPPIPPASAGHHPPGQQPSTGDGARSGKPSAAALSGAAGGAASGGGEDQSKSHTLSLSQMIKRNAPLASGSSSSSSGLGSRALAQRASSPIRIPSIQI